MIITQSNLTNFMLCPYSYFLNQIEGLFAKKESKEVSIGRAYHAGMEAMAESGLQGALAKVAACYEEEFQKQRGESDLRTEMLKLDEAIVKAMVEGSPWRDGITSVEQKFELPASSMGIKGNFLISGKIDALVTTQGLRQHLRDYKTKGNFSGMTNPDILRRNFQGLLYFTIFKYFLNYRQLDGFEWALVKRPAKRPTKKESLEAFARRIVEDYRDRPDFYFEKIAIEYSDLEIERFRFELEKVFNFLNRCFEEEQWPQFSTGCPGFNRHGCLYIPVCNKMPGWEELYDHRCSDCHPELEEE